MFDELSTHTWTLELSLERKEVADIPVYQRVPVSWSEALPGNSRGGGSDVTSFCVAPRDTVRGGIYDPEAFRKRASIDLVTVNGVTQSVKPTLPGLAEGGWVGEVGVGIAGDRGYHGRAN